MDIDGIVASWLNACLRGTMSRAHLLAAMDDLETTLPAAPGDARARLATLRSEVQAVLDDQKVGQAGDELAVVPPTGPHPTRVATGRGAPSWYIET